MTKFGLKEQLLTSLRQHNSVEAERVDYRAIFLSHIVPDPDNARFLPSVIISDEHAKQLTSRKLSKRQLLELYKAENKVIVGKACFINCCEKGSEDWKKAADSIESIIELSKHIAVSELIHAPSIYPLGNGQYQILTGHRRFFAMIYTFGSGAAAQFKVYDRPPLLKSTKQFQENASRVDLPQYGKLTAFVAAQLELEELSNARMQLGQKKLTVRDNASLMGISMGAYDNYNVLTRYPCVTELYERGLSLPLTKAKKVVLDAEAEYAEKHQRQLFNVLDKKEINRLIRERLSGDKAPALKQDKPFQFKNISDPNIVKQLFECNILQMNVGVDWNALDWNNREEVNQAIANVISYLEQQASQDSAA
ncbi:hypothetical protein KIH87_02350 [Paraneptunicella aestuarii]|uniref:ParB/Srx family N-terminal domain-containing protein n=1 Tax=Paraneptunicella aestuarii TaxID=2831148 RepID=UPI001E556F57|nr:ParB/Srx family N-terminal domain-containing protein [Paraneptunicella aestuarii]UAA39225.1 hypothetical protein KIH87_02350 [Paraneptunicella aestuarii]